MAKNRPNSSISKRQNEVRLLQSVLKHVKKIEELKTRYQEEKNLQKLEQSLKDLQN